MCGSGVEHVDEAHQRQQPEVTLAATAELEGPVLPPHSAMNVEQHADARGIEERAPGEVDDKG
jgi:hypothetical protein